MTALLRGLARLVVGALALVGLVVVLLLAWLLATGGAAPADGARSPGAGPDAPADAPDDATAGSPPGGLAADALRVQGDGVVTADGPLDDLVLEATGVQALDDGLRAEHLVASAVVPYDAVAADLGPGARLGAAGGGRVRVERDLEVLGQRIRVAAEGRVEPDGRSVVVVPESVDVGGPAVLEGALAAAARRLAVVRQPVEGLPEGVVLDEVEAVGSGFAVRASGEDVVLR